MMFVYLDESGDTGFKFLQGSTTHFVITLLVVDDPAPLREAIDTLKSSLHLAPSTEFKFSRTPPAIREQFFRAIDPLEFAIRALIVDKQRITRPELRAQENFYSYLVASVLARNADIIAGSTLVIDESAQSKKAKEDFRSYLRKSLRTNAGGPRFRRVRYQRSHTDNLLQASDMVCGALNAAYGRSRKEPQYRALIHRHISDEWAWGQQDGPD